MMRLVLNSALALLLLVVIAAGVFLRPISGRPNFDFLPQMAHSPRYNAFAANPNFGSGQTLQPPAAHTIARGYIPLHYSATPQDALLAGEQLQNPVAATGWAQQRGARVFATYCSPCHGSGGTGDGIVAQRGYPPPPSLLAAHAVDMKDGQMFHVLTYGQNNMPSYAAQVTRDDRWDAIVYIRSLQKKAVPPPAAPTPPAVAASRATGQSRPFSPAPAGDKVAEGRMRGSAQPTKTSGGAL